MTEDDNKPASPFVIIGGEPQIRALVERFYDLMELEPGYAALPSFFQTADWMRNQNG